MSQPAPLRLHPSELKRLENHYTGNCFGCDRCAFYPPIADGKPGAVEAYVAWARERGETIRTK
ncbi:MAG: hypothetical protein KC621_12075 [Myxococcales bacterium]|nr:hypothetical protein [Myxococcales bacterium]